MTSKTFFCIIIFSFIGGLFWQSCEYHEQDLAPLAAYDRFYSREAGPNGDTIAFFEDYADDQNFEFYKIGLVFPQGALDSNIIVNYYNYMNERVNYILKDSILLASEFFYFIPAYRSWGYEYDTLSFVDETRHLRINFNKKILLIYHFKDIAAEIDTSYRFFRLLLPPDMSVKFNEQGFVTGFYDESLLQVITGSYINEATTVNTDTLRGLKFWQELPKENYKINFSTNTISVAIENLDYMYCIAKFNFKDTINPIPNY